MAAALVAFLLPLAKPIFNWSAGCLAILLLWGIQAQIANASDGGYLSGLMAKLFNGYFSGNQLVYVVGVLGSLLGGMGALTGALFRDLFHRDRPAATLADQ